MRTSVPGPQEPRNLSTGPPSPTPSAGAHHRNPSRAAKLPVFARPTGHPTSIRTNHCPLRGCNPSEDMTPVRRCGPPWYINGCAQLWLFGPNFRWLHRVPWKLRLPGAPTCVYQRRIYSLQFLRFCFPFDNALNMHRPAWRAGIRIAYAFARYPTLHEGRIFALQGACV